MRCLGLLIGLGVVASPGAAQVLDLPPRPAEAPAGSAVMREIRNLDLEAREERLYAEIARGNVPGWLRTLRPVVLSGQPAGREVRVELWVTPDYLAVGSDEDWFLVPLTPQTAQRLADLSGTLLPTPKLVDAIWAAADLRLPPAPIPPSPAMTTVPVFEDHFRAVMAQRDSAGALPGRLVAGHKKDVVLTSRLAERPGKVAIYGWHRPEGAPIQPLYLGHTDRWVDYSHGIRLVGRTVTVDGVVRDLEEILGDPGLAGLVSGEGVIRPARYDGVR